MKTPKERDNLDLLELVCQLHGRASMYGNKEQHDAYVEARKELESRLQEPKDNWVKCSERTPDSRPIELRLQNVLAYGSKSKSSFVCQYVNDRFKGSLRQLENETFTHWQPLPKIPQ